MAYNYFNPQGGSPYRSQAGMLGAGAPPGMGSFMGIPSGVASGAFGSMFGGLGQLFGGGQNPADGAMPYLDQIKGMIEKYMNPYVNAGQQAIPTLQGQYGQLINDPGSVMNRIGAGFQQSPGYQFQVDQATGAANRAAAAGGMAGSPMEQQNLAGTVNQLANQDYGNYMNRGMNMYSQGLGGLSHMFDTGFNAASLSAQDLMDMFMSQAKLKYAGQANQNQADGSGWGALLGGAGSMIPFM